MNMNPVNIDQFPERENCSVWKDRIIVASTCRRTVWLLHNLTLGGNLCLRDDKNAAFGITSPSLAVAGEHGKRHTMCEHLPEAVSDWLNPISLGTMSASGYIENLA